MGLFDTLLGKTAAKASNKANDAYQAGITQAKGTVGAGYGDAKNVLYDMAGLARGAIDGSTNEVASHLSGGYAGAKNAYGTNLGSATGAINTGYGDAIGTQRNALTDLAASYSPYAEGGSRAQGLYSDFLGLNGTGAQQSAQSQYSDPYGRAIEDRTVQALNRQANAGGYIGSGRSSLAASRAVSEGAYGRQQDYLRMLGEQAARGQAGALQFGQMGLANASNIAGLQAGEGNALAGLYGTAAKDLSQMDINHGLGQANNMAQWGNATANNYSTLGGQQAGLATGEANALASLTMGGANSDANNQLAFGASKTQGLNNLLGIGFGAAQLYKGTPPKQLGNYYTPQQMQSMGYAF